MMLKEEASILFEKKFFTNRIFCKELIEKWFFLTFLESSIKAFL